MRPHEAIVQFQDRHHRRSEPRFPIQGPGLLAFRRQWEAAMTANLGAKVDGEGI